MGVRTVLVTTFVAFWAVGAPAHATPITYNFSGHLANQVGGNNSVTGQFTLDAAAASITGFTFTTPTGLVDPTNYLANVTTFTPALSPSLDFVALTFDNKLDPGSDNLALWFDTTLGSFNGSFFYVGAVDFAGGAGGSALTCLSSPLRSCNPAPLLAFDNVFIEGFARPVTPSAVPEPASMLLLGTGLVGIGARRWRNRRQRS